MQDSNKPFCPLIGTDGNIFNILGRASGTLRRLDMADKAKEMSDRVYKSGSYEEALVIIMEYVTPVKEGYEEEPEFQQFNG